MAAVVRQVAHPLGGGESRDEQAVAAHTAELLQLAQASGASRSNASEKLARDPLLLSVFFQNVDLLYEHAYAGADAASKAILGALALVDERQR